MLTRRSLNNMNIRKVISIFIVIVVLVVGGYFAYKTLLSSPDSSMSTTTAGAAAQSGPESILPNGTTLDFETIKKFNSNGSLFPYPSVTAQEASLQLNEIVKQ